MGNIWTHDIRSIILVDQLRQVLISLEKGYEFFIYSGQPENKIPALG